MTSIKDVLDRARDTKQMAELCGCQPIDLKRLVREGRIEVARLHGHWVWDVDQVSEIKDTLRGLCPNCGWKKGDPVVGNVEKSMNVNMERRLSTGEP